MSSQESTISQESAAVNAELGHGHSVAAWTAVAIMIVGFGIGSLGMIFSSMLGIIIGTVIVLLGAISWKVLGSMGYGPKGH